MSEADGMSEILRDAGRPFHLGGALASLHPAKGRVGVLIVGPFGYDAFSLHATLRRLAARIARAGWPCLRFDAPGSGQSGDPARETASLSLWRESAERLAQDFTTRAGVGRLVVVGVGAGALVAAPLARGLDAAGLALLAPWLDGRRALREYEATSRLMFDALHVPPEPVDTPGDLLTCGFLMPASLRANVAATKLGAAELGGGRPLLLGARPAQRESLDKLAAEIGAAAACVDLDGFDQAVFDPSAPAMSEAALAPVVDWTDGVARAAAPDVAPAAPADWTDEGLAGDGFVETASRFGPQGRLFGVLCRPAAGAARAGMLFLTAGRNSCVGWARFDVDQARRLARAGVASLRFDRAGVGDSLLEVDYEGMYDEARVADVSAALDELERLGVGPVGVYGRCSGAFMSYVSACLEPRIAGAAVCNNERYVWRPHETVEEMMQQSVRSIGAISGRMLEGRQWRRLLNGDITPSAALAKVGAALRKRAEARLSRYGVALSEDGRRVLGVRARFADLARRGVAMRIVISDGDRAIEELRAFLPDEAEWAALGNLVVTTIPDADHNMTPKAAREHVGREIDALIESMLARRATRTVAKAA